MLIVYPARNSGHWLGMVISDTLGRVWEHRVWQSAVGRSTHSGIWYAWYGGAPRAEERERKSSWSGASGATESPRKANANLRVKKAYAERHALLTRVASRHGNLQAVGFVSSIV